MPQEKPSNPKVEPFEEPAIFKGATPVVTR